MTVPSPHFEWIGDFEEQGPPEDPRILLTGRARLGGTPFLAKAVRVAAGERIPDLRPEVSPAAYDELELDTLLDEFETLAGTIEPELVNIAGAMYVLCVFPDEHSS